MQTRDHKKLAEMFASEMSRKRIPYISKKAFIYGNIEPDKNPFTYLHGMLKGKKFHGHPHIVEFAARPRPAKCSSAP